MRFLATIALSCILAGACGQSTFPQYNSAGGGGVGTSTTAGGSADGGPDGGPIASDGGLADAGPTMCPGDLDGTGTGTGIVVSEIAFGPQGFLEFYNRAGASMELRGLAFAGSMSSPMTPPTTLQPGARIVISANLSSNAGELALFDQSSQQLLQYVCWGAQEPTQLQNEAVMSGLWSGNCVLSPPPGDSLHLRGGGTNFGDWLTDSPTPDGCPASTNP